MKKYRIEFLSQEEITPKTEAYIAELFAQLTDIPPICISDLLRKENPPYIVVCWQDERPIAMATMVVYEVISGRKAWIEDVVVSYEFRQQGIGEQLTQTLITRAKQLGVQTILLFSNPKREAAHRLYKRLGFAQKGSTLFSMNLS